MLLHGDKGIRISFSPTISLLTATTELLTTTVPSIVLDGGKRIIRTGCSTNVIKRLQLILVMVTVCRLISLIVLSSPGRCKLMQCRPAHLVTMALPPIMRTWETGRKLAESIEMAVGC